MLLGSCTSSPAPSGRSGSPSSRPNILVILTDDQRVGTLGMMPVTRQLFMRQGTTFPNGFVTTPLCCPSRASILTGRYAHNTGVHTNGDALDLDQSTTVERYLHDAGYQTGIVGKFLNTWPLTRDPPYFDRWSIFGYGYYHTPWNVQGRQVTVNEYSTDFIAGRAVQDLQAFEARDSKPWFLYVATSAPHDPWTPEPQHAHDPLPPFRKNPAMREANLSDKPPWVRRSPHLSDATIASTRAGQLRTLPSVDDLVARVFRTLNRLGETRNTLAVFLSDNGFLWGEHGLAGKRANESDVGISLSSGKRYPYTPSIQVPFMVRWPGHLAGRATDRRIVANVDLAPTFLQAAGVRPKSAVPMDGRSFLSRSSRRDLLFEYYQDRMYPLVPTWDSIRSSAFQYTEYFGSSGRIAFREYYDLRHDPFELRNLLHDGDPSNNPDVGPLTRQMARESRCTGTAGPTACP